MPHFCTTKMEWLRTDWHWQLTSAQIRALPRHGGNLQDIYAYIGTFFDTYLVDRTKRVCVTLNCPDPWPALLHPLYLASGQNEDMAAMFLGNLYCRVAIARPEMWLSSPYPIFRQRVDPHKWAPRHYFFAPDFRLEERAAA